jgi:hypothetical protein
LATAGTVILSGFDLRNCVFNFKLKSDKSTPDDHPTEILLPEFHFPKDNCSVQVTGGKWIIGTFEEDAGMVQKLKWWHHEGEHVLKVTGVARTQASLGAVVEEEGYMEQCQTNTGRCSVM